MTENERVKFTKRVLLGALPPFMIVSLMWLLFFISVIIEREISFLGIYPLSAKGLPGIVLAPFVHGSINHLWNNSLPLLVLGTALFVIYSEVAVRIYIINHLLTGTLVWLAGREAWHIGASGVVYGLLFFLFFSGLIRRDISLMALSLLVAFLYGSMIWGIFPVMPPEISWESHMLGAFSGAALAVIFRHKGPQKPSYDWLDEDEAEDDDEITDPGDNGVGNSDSRRGDDPGSGA